MDKNKEISKNIKDIKKINIEIKKILDEQIYIKTDFFGIEYNPNHIKTE